MWFFNPAYTYKFQLKTTLGHLEGGQFGASLDYHHVENYTKSGLNIFTQSDVSCSVYTAEILEHANPSLTSDFIHDLNRLSDEYVGFIYRR